MQLNIPSQDRLYTSPKLIQLTGGLIMLFIILHRLDNSNRQLKVPGHLVRE